MALRDSSSRPRRFTLCSGVLQFSTFLLRLSTREREAPLILLCFSRVRRCGSSSDPHQDMDFHQRLQSMTKYVVGGHLPWHFPTFSLSFVSSHRSSLPWLLNPRMQAHTGWSFSLFVPSFIICAACPPLYLLGLALLNSLRSSSLVQVPSTGQKWHRSVVSKPLQRVWRRRYTMSLLVQDERRQALPS